ncbi:MAG: radical SAM protein [Gammaproteobacteria bacterium]|nr:radical SAM protein [Gammaproteobacteria bacterium]
MFKILAKSGDEKLAIVYVAKSKAGHYLEMVESIQPPFTIDQKWVLIISTLSGCPINCLMCDAGGNFQGALSKEEMFAEIDYLIGTKFPDKKITTKKFKIQFARVGEPTLNLAVLDVLRELPSRYQVSGILPSLSTVAPVGCEDFLTKLIAIKNQYYGDGRFQLQFSIHTTDVTLRDKIIPCKKWSFAEIAEYGQKFYCKSDKKIALNFALAKEYPFDVNIMQKYFDPNIFLIKITPVNPTLKASANNLTSYFTKGESNEDKNELIKSLKKAGCEVILSIGELAENKIGSNCGQYLKKLNGELYD